MHKFKIPVGDWSDDGHGKCDHIIVECNHTVDEVRQGYKDSCKLTGISFNHNTDYTGLNLKYDHPERDQRMIATEYGSSTISQFTQDILLGHGLDVWDGSEKLDDEFWIEGSEEFVKILMKFIKLSITDLEYKVVMDDLPYLNGYWNKDLNVQFGYGLFD